MQPLLYAKSPRWRESNHVTCRSPVGRRAPKSLRHAARHTQRTGSRLSAKTTRKQTFFRGSTPFPTQAKSHSPNLLICFVHQYTDQCWAVPRTIAAPRYRFFTVPVQWSYGTFWYRDVASIPRFFGCACVGVCMINYHSMHSYSIGDQLDELCSISGSWPYLYLY